MTKDSVIIGLWPVKHSYKITPKDQTSALAENGQLYILYGESYFCN